MPIAKFSDGEVLQFIVDYCNKIEAVVDMLHGDFQVYEQSWWLKDIVAMNILQIGERINSNISANFKAMHPDVPWGEYVGIRNRFAHKYFTSEDEIVWETATVDIPYLKRFCVRELSAMNMEIPIKQKITNTLSEHLTEKDK